MDSADEVDFTNLSNEAKTCKVDGEESKPPKKLTSQDELILLEDVLTRNGGNGRIVDEIKAKMKDEDDPPLIFGWQNIDSFINAIKAAQGAQPPPPPLPFELPVDLNEFSFKNALLTFVSQRAGTDTQMERYALPCTHGQIGKCAAILAKLDLHPWTRHVIMYGRPALMYTSPKNAQTLWSMS